MKNKEKRKRRLKRELWKDLLRKNVKGLKKVPTPEQVARTSSKSIA
ncbi:hypothetical protein ACFPTR_03195 [Aliibacillus thermotolerans]|uniref:FbpB family small basic protein n=1 Tax=Aliibacillus thermotolerans TaxID=1834418 RepID=A0ABW0U6D3_9BACI|nr:hypothetical protein [Aliibacillus thermotolerans]